MGLVEWSSLLCGQSEEISAEQLYGEPALIRSKWGDHVARRGVSAPDCVRKTETPLVDLEGHATEAAAGAKGRLQERLGCNDLAAVTCNYVGIVGTNGVDANAPRLQSSMAAFEWTIRAGECEWKEEVRARVRNCSTRPIPLPSCTVTHGRLQSLTGTRSGCRVPTGIFYRI